MVGIITDSTCDLTEELLKEYDIKILSHRIYLNGKEYLDKVTIQPEEVYEAMKNGSFPTTSLPSPQDIISLYKQCCEKGSGFIYIAISSKFSGTYQLAVSLQRDLQEQFPEKNMVVIDSKCGSTSQGLITLQAAKLIRAGVNFETTVEQINDMVNHVEQIFMIPDLSWLVKGGRLSSTKGWVGNVLNIKPVLHVKNGEVEVLEKVRGRKKALSTIVDIMEDRMKDFPNQTIGISHAGDMDIVSEFLDMVKQRFGDIDMIIAKVGASLVSHLGVEGVGVSFFNKKPELYI